MKLSPESVGSITNKIMRGLPDDVATEIEQELNRELPEDTYTDLRGELEDAIAGVLGELRLPDA